MTTPEYKDLLQKQIFKTYDEVPKYIRDDLQEALIWAKKQLNAYEGGEHDINIELGGSCCSICKSTWKNVFYGNECMIIETGSQAIVMAVCEYLNGMLMDVN